MLEEINIRNFAIIDSQTVPFKPGFNVMSGETGAGKSILIDALGLQLGNRADSDWIRHGESRCDIQSSYVLPSNSKVQQWLQDNEFDEDGQCQLRRTLSHNGNSKCYINAIPTTLSNTKVIGSMLVDIHGQHAHQSLMSSEKQLELLDRFGNIDAEGMAVSKAFVHWQDLVKQKSLLGGNDSNLHSQRELLQYQLDELEQLNIINNEFSELSDSQKALSSAHHLLEKTSQLEQACAWDNGIRDQLNSISHVATQLAIMDTRAENISELVNQALIYIDEANAAISDYAQSIDIDPERLSTIEARMGQLHDIARKHNTSPNELIQLQKSLNNKLSAINDTIQAVESIDDDIAAAQKTYTDKAQALSAERKKAAHSLCQGVNDRFAQLSLENAEFSIQFSEATQAKKSGIDTITFYFAPNPGQAAKPLSKIASGGELSRISLAIQVASVASARETTLIFDEVDSGIGGATAEVVGRLLKTLSRYHQVICVTHLAQVAAFSDQHIKISKTVENGKTFTQFTVLDEASTIHELARMSGGIEPDKKTQEHAKKLRDNAIQFTQTIEH